MIPTKLQQKAIDSDADLVIYGGPVGCGKTWMLRHARDIRGAAIMEVEDVERMPLAQLFTIMRSRAILATCNVPQGPGWLATLARAGGWVCNHCGTPHAMHRDTVHAVVVTPSQIRVVDGLFVAGQEISRLEPGTALAATVQMVLCGPMDAVQ